MKHALMAVVLLSAGVALAQGGKKSKAATADSKDFIPEMSAPAPEKKAAAAPVRPPAPDVAHMPFNKDSIREVMQYYTRDIQECYEEILATKGSKVEEGSILTSFTITPEGTVRNAKVSRVGTSLKNPRLSECIVNVLSSLTFPQPADKREYPIEYPFNLKALK